MILLKVPFKKKILLREKELWFAFNIGALEYATTDVLGIDLWQITDYLKSPESFNAEYDLNIAVLYGAYLMACLKRGDKPKYGLTNAVMWTEYMSASESKKLATELSKLFGSMTKGKEGKKKVK